MPIFSDIDQQAEIPKPRIGARGVGVASACWLLYALLYASAVTASEPVPFIGVLLGQIVNAVLLALLSIPAWLLVVRRMDRAGWGWKAGAHALIAPLYAFVGLEGFLLLMNWMVGSAVTGPMREQYVWIFLTYAVIYALQFALYHTVRAVQRLRRKEQQAAELAALARERELAALKAQVNPHFLFNALNSVSAAVRRDPEAAREMLETLADLLRYALDRSEGDALVSLEEELTFARRYLALESRRFGDRLDARFDLDDDALNARLPPMTLQPLVENAVRHGIAPLEEGGAVTLRTARRDGRVHVSVEDTGAGLNGHVLEDDQLPEGGVGLRNTSARLQRHFGTEARLRTAPNDPRGLRVRFSVPTDEEERRP